jgi:prepilin-type N-terminal cleavage/methylation domain-containing protein
MFDRNRESRKKQAGFTLIEPLAVTVVLGVLSASVVFAVGGITNTVKVSACKSDIKAVELASEMFFAETGAYAADISALVTANLLREVPAATNGYLVIYTQTGGVVTATGLTGCP